MIQTVTGEIKAAELGRTYIHEHIKIDLSGVKNNPDTNYNDLDGVIAELKELKEKGIDSLVEVTNRGMGRDVAALIRAAKEAKIKVIASTGFYKEPFLPQYVYEMEEETLSRLLIQDMIKGIDGTEVKAHVIGEIGSSHNQFTPMEQKVFRVAVRVHHETGRPISTHTTLGTMALEQIEFFQNNNVSLERVIIGHLDLSSDLDYHLRIADTGCYMAFDTVGKVNYQPDEKRVDHIQALIKRGHLKQIMLSEDLTRKSHLKCNGGIGYSYLVDSFIPKLRQAGITQEQVDEMLIENPRRFLGVRR